MAESSKNTTATVIPGMRYKGRTYSYKVVVQGIWL